MQNMKIIAVDFVETDSCCFCNHKLPTQTAFIIEFANGELSQCGPTCAKQRFQDIKNVPNLTMASLDHNSGNSDGTGTSEKSIKRIQNNKELAYLHLRCKYLNDFDESNKINFKFLMDVFNKNTIGIDDKDRNSIKKIMDSMKNTKLGYKNLMACYMAKRILSMWIKKSPDDYAVSLFSQLKMKCYLTEAQVNGANNWINNMKKIPKINGEWFYNPKRNPQ